VPGTEAYIAQLSRQSHIATTVEDSKRKAHPLTRRYASDAIALVRDFADGFSQNPPLLPQKEISDGQLLAGLVLPAFREVLEDRTRPASSTASLDLENIFSDGLRHWLVDSRTVFDLSQHLYALERYGCGATIRTFVLVTDWIGNRLAIRSSSRRRGQEAFRRARGKPAWYRGNRCALCEQLTQLTSARASSKNPDDSHDKCLSNRYCDDHAQPRKRKGQDDTKARKDRNNFQEKIDRFDNICEKLWSEIKRDVKLFRRFVPPGAGKRSSGEWHMLQFECRLVLWASNGEAAHELFYDFESNVRSTARLIAEAFPTNLDVEVDRLVQTGLTLVDIAKHLQEKLELVKQRSSIAVARLKSRRHGAKQIAARLGISCDDVRAAEKRIEGLRRNCDFSPLRSPELAWLPSAANSVALKAASSVVYAEPEIEPLDEEVTRIDLDKYVRLAGKKC
jgi:hypothetical protein